MRKKSGKEGFIAIVALGIFALLMFFGILVQQTVVNTYASVKNTKNYYESQNLANSMLSYLQYKLKNHAAGFSTEGKQNCGYGAGAEAVANMPGGQSPVCADAEMIPVPANETKDVRISFEVKGRQKFDVEKVSSVKCGAAGQGGCYVMPMGDGSAGSDRCKFYPLAFLPGGAPAVGDQITGAAFIVDQLDYACNWNKLTFGSSLSDRVAVPLYYDDSALTAGVPHILNVYTAGAQEKKATKLILRMRTPCLPCGVPDTNGIVPIGTRRCSPGTDINVCRDEERYQLNLRDGDEMVVQWGIDGKCEVGGRMQACGLVGYPDPGSGFPVVHASGLYESTILGAINNAVLNELKFGQPTHLNDKSPKVINNQQILPSFTEPIFTLFLNHALISTTGANIPYLEYQILTDKPIGNSSVKLEANVAIDGSSYTKTIYKEMSKPLIDFAIQN